MAADLRAQTPHTGHWPGSSCPAATGPTSTRPSDSSWPTAWSTPTTSGPTASPRGARAWRPSSGPCHPLVQAAQYPVWGRPDAALTPTNVGQQPIAAADPQQQRQCRSERARTHRRHGRTATCSPTPRRPARRRRFRHEARADRHHLCRTAHGRPAGWGWQRHVAEDLVESAQAAQLGIGELRQQVPEPAHQAVPL